MATSGSVFVGIGEGTSGLTLAWVKVARSETEIRDRERCGGIGFSVPRLSEIEGCFRFYKPTLIVASLDWKSTSSTFQSRHVCRCPSEPLPFQMSRSRPSDSVFALGVHHCPLHLLVPPLSPHHPLLSIPQTRMRQTLPSEVSDSSESHLRRLR